MFSLTSRAGMGWGWGIGIRAFIHIFSHAWSSLLFLPYFDYMWKRNFITYWLSVEVTLMKLTCLEILINVGLVECGAVSKCVVVAALAPAQKAWQRPLGLVWMSRWVRHKGKNTSTWVDCSRHLCLFPCSRISDSICKYENALCL